MQLKVFPTSAFLFSLHQEALAHYPNRVKRFDLMYEIIKKAAVGTEGLPIGLQVKGLVYRINVIKNLLLMKETLRLDVILFLHRSSEGPTKRKWCCTQ